MIEKISQNEKMSTHVPFGDYAPSRDEEGETGGCGDDYKLLT